MLSCYLFVPLRFIQQCLHLGLRIFQQQGRHFNAHILTCFWLKYSILMTAKVCLQSLTLKKPLLSFIPLMGTAPSSELLNAMLSTTLHSVCSVLNYFKPTGIKCQSNNVTSILGLGSWETSFFKRLLCC